MPVELRTTLTPLHLRQLVALYQSEWWTAGRTLPEVRAMVRCSDFVFAYVDAQDTLAAFARVLTDRVYKALLFDVIVRPQDRGTGLGARILRDVTAHPVLSKVRAIELYCRPDMEAFYRSFGFTSDTGGITLMRRAATDPTDPAGPAVR